MYSNRVHAGYKKLKQDIYKYLDENALWKDQGTISNIMHYLPVYGMYRELNHALFDIYNSFPMMV
ncbi:MAG: hypothetical protein Q4F83_15760 [Eubacteriales bacterium]|nr:hypothetical protein [Eubacteriales bacterium]